MSGNARQHLEAIDGTRAGTGAEHRPPETELNSYSVDKAAIPLDVSDLMAVKDRFLRINRERLNRVRDALNPAQRDFIDLLPLLFHTNHPLLPGYTSATTP